MNATTAVQDDWDLDVFHSGDGFQFHITRGDGSSINSWPSDLADTIDMVAHLAKRHQPHSITIDRAGIGDVILDALRNQGLPIRGTLSTGNSSCD